MARHLLRSPQAALQRIQTLALPGLLALLWVVLSMVSGVVHAQTPPNATDELKGTTTPAAGNAVVLSTLSSYKLAGGDVITVTVFGEDDLTKEKIRLTDAGTFMYPSLGEINALGQTIGDLERLITNGLKGRILVNPKVSVQIVEYRPFYIHGMVEKPGGYPFQPGLTVRKAGTIAGGFKERAALNKIFVIRENDASLTPRRVDLNTLIGPGDTITVEESFF